MIFNQYMMKMKVACKKKNCNTVLYVYYCSVQIFVISHDTGTYISCRQDIHVECVPRICRMNCRMKLRAGLDTNGKQNFQ